MATFLEICKDVRAQSGISGVGPSSVTGQTGIMADVVRWVQEAYNEIQSMYENWNFLHNKFNFILVAGNESYNLSQLVGDKGGVGVRIPTLDTLTIRLEAETSKVRLKYIPWAVWQLDARVLEGETGKPEWYTQAPDKSFHFYPYQEAQALSIDNINYVIEFYGFSEPDIMTASTDQPVIPTQHHECIKLAALMRYAEYYNSPEVYVSAEKSFKNQMTALKDTEIPRYNYYTIPFA